MPTPCWIMSGRLTKLRKARTKRKSSRFKARYASSLKPPSQHSLKPGIAALETSAFGAAKLQRHLREARPEVCSFGAAVFSLETLILAQTTASNQKEEAERLELSSKGCPPTVPAHASVALSRLDMLGPLFSSPDCKRKILG